MDNAGPIFEMGLMSWASVALASAIIFGIHGPRLVQDIRGWFKADG